jgi:hypothetical protein
MGFIFSFWELLLRIVNVIVMLCLFLLVNVDYVLDIWIYFIYELVLV